MANEKFNRSVDISPAFDKRNPNPSKNYGIHGVEMRFLLKGEKGTVQFVLFTNWMLPHVKEELDKKHNDHLLCHPQPADLGYHSLTPMYEGQEPMHKCPYLDGKDCYYDGSGLAAQEIYDVMVKHGGEAMWERLEDYYHYIFA